MKRTKRRSLTGADEADAPRSAVRVSEPKSGSRGRFLPDEGKRLWLLASLLVTATIFIYQPVWHAGFVWDDDAYVTRNPLLTAPDGLQRIWFSKDSPSQYFPLTYTTFRLERSLWGLDPAGYHWVNLLLHATNALLLWRLLARLKLPGAWLAAALFAWHPVQVETVAWITERKNVLSLLFSLLTVLCWVEFVAHRPRSAGRYYWLALGTYTLALFSKTTACTLPVALGLILWLQGKPLTRRRLMQLSPFLLLGLAFGLLTVWWERFHQGTAGKLFALGLADRVVIASHAVWFYLGKLIWPRDLCFSYPRWRINPADPLAYGWLVAGLALVAVLCSTRRRLGRAPEVAAVFYVATLGPVLGFIMLYTFRYTFVADHYQYVACIGPLALAAAGASRALDGAGKSAAVLKPVVCGVALSVLGVLTWRQSATYADVDTLWRTTIARNPHSAMAWDNRGLALLERGEVDEAIVHFRRALEVQPDDEVASNNLGFALLRSGKASEAVPHFEEALSVKPDDYTARANLGAALLQLGRIDEAVRQFRSALELQPSNPAAQSNLGYGLLLKGELDQGVVYVKEALKRQPENPELHRNLGAAFLELGRLDDAIAELREAVRLQPGVAPPRSKLADVLLRKGAVREATAQYQVLTQMLPDDAVAHRKLAWLLATSMDAAVRDGARAVELARRADQLAGGQDPVVIGTLAAAYAEAGRFSEAVASARQALQLATARGDSALADTLKRQMHFYRAGIASRDANPKDAAAMRSQPEQNADSTRPGPP